MSVPVGEWTTREEFLALRSKGLGGSDAAAICGESPWGTALSVWDEKVNGTVKDLGGNEEAARWGQLLEPVVMNEWGVRNAPRFMVQSNWTYRDDRDEFLLANPDAEVYDDTTDVNHPSGGGEVKTANAVKGSEWDEGVPDYYKLQGFHYMMVMGWPWIEFACLVGGQRFVQHTLYADEEIQAHLRELETRFWHDHVLTKIPPAPSGKKADKETLARIHRAVHGETLEADDQLANDIAALQYLKERSKEGVDEYELLDQRVRAAIGSAECVTDSTGWVLATFKVSRVGRVDTKALLARYPRVGEKFKVYSEQRRLLIKVGGH